MSSATNQATASRTAEDTLAQKSRERWPEWANSEAAVSIAG